MTSHVLEIKATRWDAWTWGGGWARALLVGEEGRGPATWPRAWEDQGWSQLSLFLGGMEGWGRKGWKGAAPLQPVRSSQDAAPRPTKCAASPGAP